MIRLMNKSALNKLGFLIAILVLAGVGYVSVAKKNLKNKIVIQETPQITPQAAPPVIFQPEGQLLTQAIDPARSAAQTSKPKVPDNPATARAGLPKYSFSNQICSGSSTEYLCLADFYKNLTGNYGASTAIADMKQRFKVNADVASNCHPLTHIVGRTAAESYKTTAEAFLLGDPFCWSGYYHGIMEGMVAKIGLQNLPNELNSICADIPGKESYNFNYYNCVHGLGHGIMAELSDEVFDSLKMCDSLTGNWEQQSCYGGVYMQNIIDSTNVADTNNVVKYLKPSDPLYPCTAVEDKYKGQCYLGQTSYVLQVNGYNFAKAFALCTTVAEPFRTICNQSMGRDAANQASHQADATKQICWLASDPNDRSNCVVGAVKEIISYYHSETQALDFCNILDDANKSTCTTTADAYYELF
ncbi:MAG: hypothetical protein ABI643_03090 [Candidatus Doudnabacteria bacterium]